MIRILFLMDTLTGGGAEQVLGHLVRGLNRDLFEITLQTIDGGLSRDGLPADVRYKAMNPCKTAPGRALRRGWLRLCTQLGWVYPLYIREDYDIEIAYLEAGPTKFLAHPGPRKGLRLAWLHCDPERKGIRNTPRMRSRYAAYDRVVCVSREVERGFRRIFGAGISTAVLRNVTDEDGIREKADAFPVPRGGEITLTAVGRLEAQKGFDRLIGACGRLMQAGFVFSLDILGEGSARTELESQIRSLGLEHRVRLRGFVENPYPYLKNSDIVVCPSRYEGFSTVVTEALILGKPVVATACAGMEELLGDSEYGLVIENSTEGIFHGLKTMLEQPETRARYALAAACRGREFSREHTLLATEQFLLKELEKKRHRERGVCL